MQPTAPADFRFWPALAAYAVPTFAIAFVWHLIAFAAVYDRLEVYRDDMIIPFGMLAIFLQGGLFAGTLKHLPSTGRRLADGLRFGALAGLFSWTFTTLAVAAKHPMTSVGDFVAIETAFTAVQWLVAGPLMVWAGRRAVK